MLAFGDFPDHVQLLLLAARARLRHDELQQIHQLAARPIDWPEFLALAAHHRISSLVFDSLDLARPTGLPEPVRLELQHRARSNAFEALRYAAEVRRIAESFSAAGIQLTVLKGVPLSQFIFGNPSARHVGDIDLLTQPDRLPQQIELLSQLGYQRINPRSRLTPHRTASFVRFWKDFTFQNLSTGFDIDLHWRLFNNRFHPANRILAEATYQTITVFGVPMRVFSPPDQFLYIAAHGLLDAWTYFKGLADVAGFLRAFTPEQLDQALLRADQLGLLNQISGAIHLANDWMGCTATNPRLASPDEAVARRIRERASSMLLCQDFKPDRAYPSPAQWMQLELDLIPGIRSRAEIARRFVWRPRVWNTIDLPDTLFWLYPILGLLLPPRIHSVED